MSITTLEPTTIEHLDFEPACEMTDCDGLATHMMVSLHKCYCDCFLCTPCVEALASAWLKLNHDPHCPRCYVQLSLDQPIFRFEPLP